MTDSVLVAYGSKYGSTAEIAERLGDTLRQAGYQVQVFRAGRVGSLDGYRAVVLGSAVYMARWRPEAVRLLARLARHRADAPRDVWLFSSGPVGEDKGEPAEKVDRWTRPKRVEQLAAQVGAREHVVFGGCISADAGGFMRKKMAQGIPPQWHDKRDWNAIDAWARGIGATLHEQAPA